RAKEQNMTAPRSVALPGWIAFASDQILHRLPRPNERKSFATHQRLGGQRPRVIVRRHHETVSAGAHQRDEIALFHFRQLAVLREKIAALTNGAHDINARPR